MSETNPNQRDSVAILVDGSFFLKRYQLFAVNGHTHTPEETAENFYRICMAHLSKHDYLYRILFYDCEPLNKRIQHPITKENINLISTNTAKFRLAFFEQLKKRRKVALRLGLLKSNNEWLIKPEHTKALISGNKKIEDLEGSDIIYDVQQKRVDMKIGLDIASLALKRQVSKIILISGDSDFVPAAKLARREGIDFVLDPMWKHIDSSLFEHIDGMKTTIKKKISKPRIKKSE